MPAYDDMPLDMPLLTLRARALHYYFRQRGATPRYAAIIITLHTPILLLWRRHFFTLMPFHATPRQVRFTLPASFSAERRCRRFMLRFFALLRRHA